LHLPSGYEIICVLTAENKPNERKNDMKKILIWSLILVLAAVVSVIGTIAYFTAVDEEVNVMVVDDARIEIVEYERVNTNDKNTNAVVKEFRDNKPLIPSVVKDSDVYSSLDNNAYASFSVDNAGKPLKAGYTYPIWNPDKIAHEIDKMVFVKNTGDCNVYVRLCFAFEAGNYVRIDRFKEMVHMNLNGDKNQWVWSWNDKLAEVDGTRCFIAWATYQKPVAPGELTDISLAQIALDHTAINDNARAFGDTYDVKVFAQGIQSDGFTTASAALSNGFGDTIPFKTVKFLEFTDLKTAIYKAGDLNTVTFGLTSEHPDVVKSYNGILVANIAGQADFTAYAYHVPAGNGLYDVYVLADNWKICMPKDSKQFFIWKRKLKKVDTSNLDVSHVENMSYMFQECNNLAEIDVSKWDVSNVTNMQGMFEKCDHLEALDVSNWDVSNVTTMNALFLNCGKLVELDVSNWEVDKVTDMQKMFLNCYYLSELDCSSWNVDNVATMSDMFKNCQRVTALDLSGWNVSNVDNMAGMFAVCKSLASLDIAGWKFVSTDENGTVVGPSVTTMNSMFAECYQLKSLDLSSWNVSEVTDMVGMFKLCSALESLNVSTWNVSNVTGLSQAFYKCGQLKSLDVSQWKVGNVTAMNQMFSDCYSLKTLDLSGWNVSKVTDMNQMFSNNSALVTLDLSGWDVSNVTDMTQMFYSDSALTTIYADEDWNVNNVASHNKMFSNCTSLPEFDSGKVDKNAAKLTTNGGYFTKKK
jgi:surface protein